MPCHGVLPCWIASGMRNSTYRRIFQADLLIGRHSMPGGTSLSIAMWHDKPLAWFTWIQLEIKTRRSTRLLRLNCLTPISFPLPDGGRRELHGRRVSKNTGFEK